MSRFRDEHGLTLVEVLLAMTLMLLVTTATLQTLGALTKASGRGLQVIDSVERARGGLARLTRGLRNASVYPTAGAAAGQSILRATPFDIAFRTVAPTSQPTAANPHAVETIRYCLDSRRRVVVQQRQPDVAMPAEACPDASWRATDVVADVANGSSRPLFSYDAAASGEIAKVGVHLVVDVDPARAPAETALSSGVYLRNQNRRPTAAFTAVAGPNRHVQLNGSASVDPEGQMLSFTWKDGAQELPERTPVIDYLAPATGVRTITLEVVDAAGLSHSMSQTIEVRG